ncbi:MAG: S8 family peptidase [Candidatus Sericytochromatia bacterium]
MNNPIKNTLKTSLVGALALLASGSLTACNRFANPTLMGNQANLQRQSQIPTTARRSTASYVPGQVVVQFRAQTNPAVMQQFAAQNGLQLLRTSPMGTALFRQVARADSNIVMQSLRRSPLVENAYPNTLYRRQFTVNDPRSAEQSGLAMIGMAKAWDINMGSPNVTIAVIDSGADLSHPDLQPNLVNGYNVLSQGQTPPQDDNGHGTHASGIAAAAGDNRIGVTGACPRCKLMPIKALDANGSGTGFDVAVGLIWAVDNGAQVINMSLGGEESDPTLERAVKYALARGSTVVVAAGNNSTDVPMYPAALPGVISVGSVDVSRARSSFSNYGTWVSIMAPGSQILSTMPMGTVSMNTTEGYRNEYDLMDGTSMAAPMVAGVVGLIKSRYPQLSPAQIKTRIEGTAIDLGGGGFDPEYGNGMIDALRAVL